MPKAQKDEERSVTLDEIKGGIQLKAGRPVVVVVSGAKAKGAPEDDPAALGDEEPAANGLARVSGAPHRERISVAMARGWRRRRDRSPLERPIITVSPRISFTSFDAASFSVAARGEYGSASALASWPLPEVSGGNGNSSSMP